MPLKPATGAYIATVGTFDGVHRGHCALLRFLVAKGAELGLTPLVVTFTSHPLALIRPERVPPRLCAPQESLERLRAVLPPEARVVAVPFTRELRSLTARRFMERLRDDYGVSALVLGHDNTFGADRLRGFMPYLRVARSLGLRLFRAPRVSAHGHPVSSSAIRRAVAAGRVDHAALLLGREPVLSGIVEHGQALGRTIGFPTANILPAPGMIVPPAGVYAATAILPDGREQPAVVNVGRRPTVDASAHPRLSIEAHLPGFSGDLYGQPLTLRLRRLIRPERRFPSLEALREQIALDVAQAFS